MSDELTRTVLLEISKIRKDAERYRWLRNLLSVEDIDRLVQEREQYGFCVVDEAESVRTDSAVDKAIEDYENNHSH